MSTAWLVTGAGGQLGHDLLAVLEPRGESVTAVGRAQMDLTDEASVRGAVRSWLDGVAADRAVVLNAAAYTAVDDAETDEETALTVNGLAPGWLAEELQGRGRLVHVSTDYVFDGTATTAYPVDAPVAPRTAYGRTKAAGERAVLDVAGDALVVRTAWVFGQHGGNFVRTMMRLESDRPTVDVVDDQTGSPTWSADLAGGLVQAALEGPRGVLHCTNAGATTWHGLARRVFEAVGADPERVRPTSSAAFVRPAERPAFSVLDGVAWQRAGLTPLRPWGEAVEAAVSTMRDS